MHQVNIADSRPLVPFWDRPVVKFSLGICALRFARCHEDQQKMGDDHAEMLQYASGCTLRLCESRCGEGESGMKSACVRLSAVSGLEDSSKVYFTRAMNRRQRP
jgi:hypothetical protein